MAENALAHGVGVSKTARRYKRLANWTTLSLLRNERKCKYTSVVSKILNIFMIEFASEL